MAVRLIVAADFTPIATLEQVSTGNVWIVSGGSANTFASDPNNSTSQITATTQSNSKAGTYTFSVSHANLTAAAEGWYRWYVRDPGDGLAVNTVEFYMKEGEEYVRANPIYYAYINFTVDGANSRDEYTVTWFKDGARIASGITSPTIQVVKRADGTDLIASTSMNQIGTTGSYYKNESTNRLGTGEAALVVVSATIDGATRTSSELVSRDD